MVSNNYETRLSEALAVASSNKIWSLRQNNTKLDVTINNPQIRTINNSVVFSADILMGRGGVILFHDRVNFLNPPLGYRNDNNIFVYDPIKALKDSILDVINAITNRLSNPHNKFLSPDNFSGDTLAVRSSTADGSITSDFTTSWNTVRNGNSLGDDNNNTVDILEASNQGPGTQYVLVQLFLDFNTSSLGAGATVSNGVFTLYGNSSGVPEVDTDNYDIQIRPYNWGGTLTTADWIDVNPSTGWTNLTLMAHFDVGSWDQGSGNANNFTVDSYADISKTATTYVVAGMSALGSGTAPTGVNTVPVRMADQSGTTSDPLLTVTYTPVRSLVLRKIPSRRSQHRR